MHQTLNRTPRTYHKAISSTYIPIKSFLIY